MERKLYYFVLFGINLTFYNFYKLKDRCYFVSPHSNNAYKSTAPLVKIDISIKGGAFHMPEQKLTIVPVTLHSDTENISNIKRKPEIKK